MADVFARLVGVDRALAEVLPEDKVHNVHLLQANGKKVAKVGDGINEALRWCRQMLVWRLALVQMWQSKLPTSPSLRAASRVWLQLSKSLGYHA